MEKPEEDGLLSEQSLPFCFNPGFLEAVVFKLYYASESPRRIIKIQISGLYFQSV